jgi:hypothetical protein
VWGVPLQMHRVTMAGRVQRCECHNLASFQALLGLHTRSKMLNEQMVVGWSCQTLSTRPC